MVVHAVAIGAARAGAAATRGVAKVAARGARATTRDVRRGAQYERKNGRIDSRTKAHLRQARREADRSTTDERFEENQEERTTGQYLLNERDRKRQEKIRKLQVQNKENGKLFFMSPRKQNREFAATATTKGAFTAMKKQASYMVYTITIGTCFPLYITQLSFAIFSLLGLAISAGIASGVTDIELINDLLSWVAKLLIPEETIFVVGWIIASSMSMMQLSIILITLIMRGINPLKGNNIHWLMTFMALSMMPFVTLIPFGFIFLFIIYRSGRS